MLQLLHELISDSHQVECPSIVMQLQHSEGVESGERRDAYKKSLAKCYIADGRSSDALGLLWELPQHTKHDPTVLSLIADAQVALAQSCAGVFVHVLMLV